MRKYIEDPAAGLTLYSLSLSACQCDAVSRAALMSLWQHWNTGGLYRLVTPLQQDKSIHTQYNAWGNLLQCMVNALQLQSKANTYLVDLNWQLKKHLLKRIFLYYKHAAVPKIIGTLQCMNAISLHTLYKYETKW